VIIDCHGHYTSAPRAHLDFHERQLARLADASLSAPRLPRISDDEIRESIEGQQLQQLRERGEDLMLFSPQASLMHHHVADRETARVWAEASNDLICRVTELFPNQFAGVCQLPQIANAPLVDCVAELRRCVTELGFVGCNLSPDPSGGHWTSKPLTDEYWYPLYEVMVELDVPAMIHVSASCNANFHALGAHYINADTTAFMQFVEGDLFGRFPKLRFVIPHGGGAVPYHWGRYRGLAARLGRPPGLEHVMGNVFFDTSVYHQAGVDLLFAVVNTGSILFASEMLGAVRGVDPETGHHWDDTKRYVDAAGLTAEERAEVFEGNARRVYPRLAARLSGAASRR
jgi:4-oxalmesaconate hydratase